MKTKFEILKEKIELEIDTYKNNQEEMVDFNQTLSFIFHHGILRALNNKNLKYNRDLTNKISKLHSKFTGFSVNKKDKCYFALNFFADIELMGEILALEYFSGAFKKYEKIQDKEFPMYFGWSPKHCLVTMTPDFRSSQNISPKFGEKLPNFLPGDTDMLDFNDLDPNVLNSYLFYFAENGLPKETSLDVLSDFVKRLSDSLQ